MNCGKFRKELLLLWAYASFLAFSSAEPPILASDFRLPGAIPPIADADPSDRQPASIRMPAKHLSARKGDKVTMTPAEFEEIKLTVGKNMATGHREEMKICQGHSSSDQWMSMSSGLNWEPSQGTLLDDQGKWPKGEFAFEYTITFFETDMPAQHMWSPESGKAYRVLWTHTYRIPAWGGA